MDALSSGWKLSKAAIQRFTICVGFISHPSEDWLSTESLFQKLPGETEAPNNQPLPHFLPSVTLVQSISRNPAGLCRRSRWELEKKKNKSTGEQIDKLISDRDECDFVFPLAADRWRLQRMRGGKKERQKKKKKKWPPLTELQRNSSLYIRNAL